MRAAADHDSFPWHCLYFLPLPHGHGSLRPTFGIRRRRRRGSSRCRPCRPWRPPHRDVRHRRARFGVVGVLELDVLEMAALLLDLLGGFLELLRRLDLHVHHDARDFLLDRVEHRGEQLERFALVFLLRVLLRIAAQVDALAQVIQRGQVLAPVRSSSAA
jgi:hypothetical protein